MGKIVMGPDEPIQINTSFGQAIKKRDIEIVDSSGRINNFQVFGNRLKNFGNGDCYQITNFDLNSFHSALYMGLTRGYHYIDFCQPPLQHQHYQKIRLLLMGLINSFKNEK